MKKAPAIFFSLCVLTMLGGCDDYFTFMIEPTEMCEDGKTRFYPSENGYCIHQECINHNWKEIDKDKDIDSCNNVSCAKETPETTDYVCGKCLNNDKEYQYQNGVCMRKTCKDGRWPETYNEVEPDVTLCGQCEDGETRYYPNEIGICVKQKCENKNWKTGDSEACGHVSCNYIKLSSEAGDSSDDRNGYYLCGECNNNTDDYLLKDGQCYKRTCNNGKWGEQIKELSLESCSCKEGSSTYINEDNICKKFDCIDGNDEEDKLFDCNNSCYGDACGECVNEDIRFINIDNKCMREVCMNGKWTKTDNFTCNYSCTDISKFDDKSPEELTLLSCGECLNGSDYYRNDEQGFCKKYNCEIGELILSNEESNCSASCNPNLDNDPNGACGECHNGDIRFDNKNDICKRSICKDGVWVADDYYGCTNSCSQEGPSINGADQCGVCVNGESLFQNDDENICQRQVCEEGTYQSPEYCENSDTCPDGQCSCSDNGCGECINGTTRCSNDGNAIETCINGQFIFTVKCPTSCKERDGYASCQATCNGNETKCTNTNNIGIKSVCQDGEALESPCQGNVLCASDKECGECQFGETICENSTIKTCLNGKWQTSACPNNYSCSDDNKCGECIEGKVIYSNLANQHCQKYLCTHGRWEVIELCSNHVSCNSSNTACGECTNYTFSTYEKDLYTCLNGKKDSNEDCDLWPHQAWSGKDRFVRLGEYIACYESSFNSNEEINCYNKRVGDKLIGYSRNDDTPCSNNNSCRITDVNRTECGECQELSTRCNNEKPQTCINGKWMTDLPEWHTADRCASQG